jgi:hypothetical protein
MARADTPASILLWLLVAMIGLPVVACLFWCVLGTAMAARDGALG